MSQPARKLTIREALEVHALDEARRIWPDKPAPEPAADAPWHIVHVVGRSDLHAREWLTRMHIPIYYPMVRELRPVARKRLAPSQRPKGGVQVMAPRLVPMFPRYLFARLSMKDVDWHFMRDIAGLSGLVCARHEDEGDAGGALLPVAIPASEIEALRGHEVDGAVPGKTPAHVIFRPGARVRVDDGPFAGFEGAVENLFDRAIEDIDADTRIRVAVEIFGRGTPVDLAFDQITRL